MRKTKSLRLAFGLADVEQQVPVTPTTRFRIASISKAVTAVGRPARAAW